MLELVLEAVGWVLLELAREAWAREAWAREGVALEAVAQVLEVSAWAWA